MLFAGWAAPLRLVATHPAPTLTTIRAGAAGVYVLVALVGLLPGTAELLGLRPIQVAALLLVLLLVTYYGLPQLGINPSFYWKIILAMGLYTGAFVAESLRSGINGIPLGQAEASRSLGFTFGQSMTQVVLPQAFRNVVPPLASVFIALTKNTSLAMSFGIAEAAFRMKGLINDYATERWTIFIGIALGYIIIVETISFGAAMLERRWRAER